MQSNKEDYGEQLFYSRIFLKNKAQVTEKTQRLRKLATQAGRKSLTIRELAGTTRYANKTPNRFQRRSHSKDDPSQSTRSQAFSYCGIHSLPDRAWRHME
ncbi:hypothetical protein AVEN_180851-1 [Araneus ventricosus]|uniref:Uncharacterized protein n=1 Tax=Araneus ventricosus TaxID=182803 RepID=A0A4Y2HAD9_ARAVE|nr:hypothetical protein AVEN_180851-1 [Araneus ventricosus]